MASLDGDADELLLFSRALRTDYDAAGLVIMGHSTGCQDAVRFMQRHAAAGGATPILGTVLQAPVGKVSQLFMLQQVQPEEDVRRVCTSWVSSGACTCYRHS